MYRITIHCEADGLEMLEPIAKHLGHIEVAIDALAPSEPPTRVIHPVIEHVIDAERDERSAKRELTRTERVLRDRARRKAEVSARMSRISPGVIAKAACPSCGAPIGSPCRSERADFGFHGHTHLARRQAAGVK